MPRGRDKMWEYAEVVEDRLMCVFCQDKFTGGISRMKYRWLKLMGNDVQPCKSVSDEVMEIAFKAVNEMQQKSRANKRKRDEDIPFPQANTSSSVNSHPSLIGSSAQSSGNSCQPKVLEFLKRKEKEAAYILGVKFLIANNHAFNILRSEELKAWCLAIGQYGPGYMPPGSEIARTKDLGTIKDEAAVYVKSIQETWSDTGCTLMSDSWTDARRRPHVNLLASSPSGVVFLKSQMIKANERQTGAFLANFIMTTMEEIGANNVVQVITDNASNYGSAGNLIEERYPHVFKTACATHCIELMLEGIDKLDSVSPVMEKAKTIVNFLYKNPSLLAIMRKFTDGRELKRFNETRFATQFLCLQSLVKEQEPLRFMVISNDWNSYRKANSRDAKEVAEYILSNTFWEQAKKILKCIEPLVKLLRLSDSDHSTMGYLYEGLERVKASIKNTLADNLEEASKYVDVIETKRTQQLYNPIHVVAAYLNPKLFYEKRVAQGREIKEGLGIFRDRMLDEGDRLAFVRELYVYHSRSPKVFSPIAIDALSNTHPRLWWDLYGSEVPNIRKIAMRLLSQTCSASACERNWSAFKAAQTKKRTHLEPKRLHDLVYCRMNLHMQKTSAKKMEEYLKPIDLDEVIAFPYDEPLEVDLKIEAENDLGDSYSDTKAFDEDNFDDSDVLRDVQRHRRVEDDELDSIFDE